MLGTSCKTLRLQTTKTAAMHCATSVEINKFPHTSLSASIKIFPILCTGKSNKPNPHNQKRPYICAPCSVIYVKASSPANPRLEEGVYLYGPKPKNHKGCVQ